MNDTPRPHPLSDIPMPDGWDPERVEKLTLTVAHHRGGQGDLTDEEFVIAQLGYSLTKRTYAARNAMASARRRGEEIARITGEPYQGIGRAKTFAEIRKEGS